MFDSVLIFVLLNFIQSEYSSSTPRDSLRRVPTFDLNDGTSNGANTATAGGGMRKAAMSVDSDDEFEKEMQRAKGECM